MKELKDWKFYDNDGELKLYVLSDDENGNPIGKVYKLVAEPVDVDDLSDLNVVPTGGTEGQVLTKYGSQDTAYDWADVNQVPTNGSLGQFLMRYGEDADQVRFADVSQVPSGGTTGQVLTKTADGYEWANIPS